MTFWRGLFAVAALFNFAVAAAMLAAPAQVAERLDISGPGGPFAILMTAILIGAFGVGYALVARAPAQNRGIVWIGAIGKLGVVVLAAMQYGAGIVPAGTFALSLGDLVFVLLFALFLWRGPR